LAEIGRLTTDVIDYVIIPEPLDVDRICVGHRGVYWFELTTRGRISHGSMPFLGVSAIDHMGEFLHRLHWTLEPKLAARLTSMPVVPEGARRGTINVNSVIGGQAGYETQSPCVADHCTAILDRRFLAEESADHVKAELVELLDGLRRDVPEFDYELRDLMLVHPVRTPEMSPIVSAVAHSIEEVLGRQAAIVASPGTYDHKHVARIGGILDCIAYGPGRLEVSHLPDEWCDIDDLVRATQVIALSILELVGPPALHTT
jgi:succinyl-diaminopimelate desuccinylase